jgi:hypothetical protein
MTQSRVQTSRKCEPHFIQSLSSTQTLFQNLDILPLTYKVLLYRGFDPDVPDCLVDGETFIYTGTTSHQECDHYYMRLKDLVTRLEALCSAVYNSDYEDPSKVPFPLWDVNGEPLDEKNKFLQSTKGVKTLDEGGMRLYFAFYCGVSTYLDLDFTLTSHACTQTSPARPS